MLKLCNVGCHLSPNYMEWKEALDMGIKTIQVMVGNPRSYTISGARPGTDTFVERNDINLIVHGPYVTSHVALPNTQIAKLSAIVLDNITKAAIYAKAKAIVLHVGGISEGETVREAFSILTNTLVNWSIKYASSGVTLCMETDPGSKNGRRVGGVKFLYQIVKTVNAPNVRLCWDWEHSWANGLDIRNLKVAEQILQYTYVMHANAIPHYVERGSHLDRHSETLFRDSQLRIEDYLNLFHLAQQVPHEILCVLERNDLRYVRQDRQDISGGGWQLW